MDLKATKQELRKKFGSKRRQLTNVECQLAARQLLEHLQPLLANIKTFAIYYAYANEISLQPLIEFALTKEYQIYSPVALRSTRVMRFEQLLSGNLATVFVAEDYKLTHEIKWYNLDLVLLPLLAVDYKGYRLGQGGGYYDTTFAQPINHPRPLLCGVGYDWQLVDSLPHEEWDLQLDYFASNNGLHQF